MCRNSVTARKFKRYSENRAHKRYPEDDSLNSRLVKRAASLLRGMQGEIPAILVQVMLLTINTRHNTRQYLLRFGQRQLQMESIEMQWFYNCIIAVTPSLSVFWSLALLVTLFSCPSLSLSPPLPFAAPLSAGFIRNVMNTIMCATLITNAVKPIMLITEIKFIVSYCVAPCSQWIMLFQRDRVARKTSAKVWLFLRVGLFFLFSSGRIDNWSRDLRIFNEKRRSFTADWWLARRILLISAFQREYRRACYVGGLC